MILDDIVAEKKRELVGLVKKRRSLIKGLSENGLTLIAEIKKASPSRGIIADNFEPEEQLKGYIRAGAGAISILTDKKFFQGGKEILSRLRELTILPILRKDFIIEPLQVYESLFLGADVLLLIAALLDTKRLSKLVNLSHQLGMEVLLEVHDRDDLIKALKTKARILGINNRNLRDFTVDIGKTSEIMSYLEEHGERERFFVVSESGIRSSKDIVYIEETGVDGVLIGEALMTADNPVSRVRSLFAEGDSLAN